MDKQKVLETIDAALEAIQSFKQALDEGKTLISDIDSRTLLKEVKSLLEIIEQEKDSSNELNHNRPNTTA